MQTLLFRVYPGHRTLDGHRFCEQSWLTQNYLEEDGISSHLNCKSDACLCNVDTCDIFRAAGIPSRWVLYNLGTWWCYYVTGKKQDTEHVNTAMCAPPRMRWGSLIFLLVILKLNKLQQTHRGGAPWALLSETRVPLTQAQKFSEL